MTSYDKGFVAFGCLAYILLCYLMPYTALTLGVVTLIINSRGE